MSQNSKYSEGKKVMIHMLEDMFGDCCENFQFEKPNDSTAENGQPTPTYYVNLKIIEADAPAPTVPSTFIQSKIVENILGFMPTNATLKVDKSYELKLKTSADVNKLVSRKEIELNDIKYFIAAEENIKRNRGQGTIYRPDLIDWHEQNILESIDGAVEVYAFTRKIQVEGKQVIGKTGLFKVTFETNEVPREAHIAMVRTKINLFFEKPMFCYNCGQFGHTTKRCTNKQKCLNCGKEGHDEPSCSNEAKCVNCLKKHAPTPKACQIYKFEENCIRYATIAQISVFSARKHALELINSHIVDSAENPTIAQAVKEGKKYNVVMPGWYKQKKAISETSPEANSQSTKPPMTNMLGSTYFATYMNVLKSSRMKEIPKSVNPHIRAAININNRPAFSRRAVDYGDLHEMETEDENIDGFSQPPHKQLRTDKRHANLN